MKLRHITFSLFLLTLNVFSQGNLYSALTIPEHLKKNAYAVMRSSETNVSINSINGMVVKEKRVVTIFNKKGSKYVNAYVHYDKNVKIKALQAAVYNEFGQQIKKIKKGDFEDVSAVSGGTLYSDSRVKYLNYTPTTYPYTIEFVSEITTSNTAFIPQFFPIRGYFLSIENSTYKISYPQHISLRKKEINTEEFNVEKEISEGNIRYKLTNVEVFKKESYSPPLQTITPKVLFASKQFSLEGVETTVENWNDFGKWMYNDLVKAANDLPESTINAIKELVKNEKSTIDKAKKIYQYVQDKTRYVSVQIGIGGWKPYSASYVDKLGYGDCKALTNYTMSLLDAVGIESNYTVIFAGRNQRNMDKDFTSMQGNHACLTLPIDGENIWLECTSQKVPFGFIGSFTDDRDALIIKPDGAEIKRTKKYTKAENSQVLKGYCSISEEGYLKADLKMISMGIQYNDKYRIEDYEARDKDVTYKKRWNYINNLTIDKIDINNNKAAIQFEESLSLSAKKYSKNVGDRMLFEVNILNRNAHVPNRYKNRTLPFEIKRGFIDKDNVEIELPSGYVVESLPKNASLENKYGHYKTEIVLNQKNNSLSYSREFSVNDGLYPKEYYDSFRAFYKEVARLDKAKVILIKKQ